MKRIILKKIPKREKPQMTMVVDLKYLAYRSRYTQGAQLSYNDIKTTVPYYVLNTMLSMAKKFEITKCIICADISGVSIRKQSYPGYKDKSNKQQTEQDLKLGKMFDDEYKNLLVQLPSFGLMPYSFSNHLSVFLTLSSGE